MFAKGAAAYPRSSRMLAGLGAALYANGFYDEAALRLCSASDLDPSNPAPYIFLGEMEKTAPEPLGCVTEKLARFVHEQPGNARANSYYAVLLWKRERASSGEAESQKIEALLNEAVRIDPKFAEADVELGNVRSSRGNLQSALDAYKRALELNPQLAEAHYRLGLAYKRVGERTKAQEQFQLYQQIDKAEAIALERQRRELRQYLITLKDRPAAVRGFALRPDC